MIRVCLSICVVLGTILPASSWTPKLSSVRVRPVLGQSRSRFQSQLLTSTTTGPFENNGLSSTGSNRILVTGRGSSSKNSKYGGGGGALVKALIKWIAKTLKVLLAIILWAPRHILDPLFGGKKTTKSRPKQRAADSAPTESPASNPVLDQKLLETITLEDKAAKYQAIKDTISTGNLILDRVNGTPVASASDPIRAARMPSPVEIRKPAPAIPDAAPSPKVLAAVPSPPTPAPLAVKPPAAPAPIAATISTAIPEPAAVMATVAAVPELTPTAAVAAEVTFAPTMKVPSPPKPPPAVVESTALATTQKDENESTALSFGVQLNVLVLMAAGVAVSSAALMSL